MPVTPSRAGRETIGSLVELGSSTLDAGAGNDSLYGGLDDALYGGDDSDTLVDNGGAVVLDGGNGDDRFQTYDGGTASIDGGDGVDRLSVYGDISGMTISNVEVLVTDGSQVIGTVDEFAGFSEIRAYDDPGYDLARGFADRDRVRHVGSDRGSCLEWPAACLRHGAGRRTGSHHRSRRRPDIGRRLRADAEWRRRRRYYPECRWQFDLRRRRDGYALRRRGRFAVWRRRRRHTGQRQRCRRDTR